MPSPRSLPAICLAVSLLGFLAGGGDRGLAALLTDSENDPSTFTTAPSFSGITYRLHNNPTPPAGNTNQQANLTINTTPPSATTLYNYDQDRDAFAGRLIVKGGSGVGETDLTKYQNWRTGLLVLPQTINGTVTFQFWSAIKDFGLAKQGVVTAFLRDFNPATSTYTTIATATLTVANWQGGSTTWVQKTLTMSASSYIVVSGRRIELKIIVGSTAADDMWFGYDTTTYDSTLALP